MRRKQRTRLLATAMLIVAASALLALAAGNDGVLYEGETLRSWRWQTETEFPDQYFALLMTPADLRLARLALPEAVWSSHGDELARWVEDPDAAAVVAYLGEAPTGGYGIRIRQVRVDRGIRPVVTVVVDRRSPGPGEFVTMVITYPVDIVPIPQDGLPQGTFTVRFVDGQGRVLSEQRVAAPLRDSASQTPSRSLGRDSRPGAASGVDVEPEGLLRVTGYGEVTAAPDRATVTFAAVGRAETAQEAQQEMNVQLNGVLRALEAFGLPEGAVRTRQFALNPQYRYESGQSYIVGYEARTQLEVRLDQLERLGELVQTLVNNGITEVNRIEYGLQDVRAAQAAALREAANDARWRAETLAEALGQRLVGIAEIHDQSQGAAQPVPLTAMRAALAAEDASAPEFPPNELTVRAQVLVVFQTASK